MHQSVEADDHAAPATLVPVEGAAVPADPRQTLSQVRNLLFGDAQRQTDNRLSHLFDLMRDIEASNAARMDAIEARMAEERARAENQRRRDLIALGDAIESLGRDVKRLAAD